MAGDGVLALRERLAAGALRAVEMAESCLKTVTQREETVRAWAWIDPMQVRADAARLDAHRASGRPIGPLHGLPVGVKDVIDVAGMPGENGAVADRGRRPTADATVVARLRAAGALVMGKTATTELAFLHPAPTRNPVNPDHTPGGSSAGSAAAVAAGMAALAIGTQTGGSVIRPAAYCGVVGFKPSFGLIPRGGVLAQSATLDTVGVFAPDIAGVALLADALAGWDAADPATAPQPAPRLLDAATAAPPVTPALAFVQPPGWEQTDAGTRDAFAELVGLLGDACDPVALPSAFEHAAVWRERINAAEMALCYHRYDARARDTLSAAITAFIDRGKALPARDYLGALDGRRVLQAGLAEIFRRFDAILCPATPTTAPPGLGSTGSAIFNGLWTLVGAPAITLPLLQGENGLPIGVQLVGAPGDDGRLLRTARWLTMRIEEGT